MTSGKESFGLVNVKTFEYADMVQGSAQTSKDAHSLFFIDGKNGFEMHFTTRQSRQNKEYEYNYHCMHFKDDFVGILKDFGRLPYNSIRASLQAVKTEQDEKAQLLKQLKELDPTANRDQIEKSSAKEAQAQKKVKELESTIAELQKKISATSKTEANKIQQLEATIA